MGTLISHICSLMVPKTTGLLCFPRFCYVFAMFLLCFTMFLLCFAMFCYVLLCFYYVLLRFAMFSYVFLCFPMFLLCFAIIGEFGGVLRWDFGRISRERTGDPDRERFNGHRGRNTDGRNIIRKNLHKTFKNFI